VALLVSGASAQEGAASGTGESVNQTVLARVSVEDTPGHELIQSTGLDRLTTPDPILGVSFEGAELRRHDQSDVVRGSGVIRGYGVWQAATGEKLFMVYGYKVPPFPESGEGVVPFDGTFEWIGGTGRLTDVRGAGALQGEITRAGRAKYRWNGTYRVEP
ncbi:MAG: hypothetical protein ACREQY_03315, partial [Candidatus Binatia bacterium]